MRRPLQSGPSGAAILLAALTFTCLFAVGTQAAGINHFQAAAGPHNYVVTNHPAVLRHMTLSSWLLTSYAHDSLVCRDESGEEAYSIVEHQVNADLAAAWGLFDRFEVGAAIPGVWLNGPKAPPNPSVRCGSFDPNGVNTLSVADPRVFAKVLLTPWNEGVVASLRVATDIPLAQFNQEAGPFAGERRFPNFTPALTAGYTSEWFKVGVDLGMTFREPAPVGDLVVGQAINYGLATEITVVPSTFFVDLDLFGKAAPAFLLGTRDQFPLEGVVAGKLFLGPVVLLGGVGAGLIADYGAPDARVFAGIGYYPLPEKEEEPALEGPSDRDSDGILDKADACPDAPEDIDGFEDKDGCPDVDNDEDGILDIDDSCPDDPEDRDRWEDADGCPDPDNDEDQILDDVDECPNDPEVYNEHEDEDGCPDSRPDDAEKVVVIVKRDKVEILDKVFFAFDSDRILPKSYALLDKVAQVIVEHTEIPKILVEGHTDADGPAAYNLTLSDRRAKSVMRYLIAAGVEPERLLAEGFGESAPIESNASEAGKAKNRRVEFKIVEAEADAPGDADEDEDEGEGDDLPAGEDEGEDAPAEPADDEWEEDGFE